MKVAIHINQTSSDDVQTLKDWAQRLGFSELQVAEFMGRTHLEVRGDLPLDAAKDLLQVCAQGMDEAHLSPLPKQAVKALSAV